MSISLENIIPPERVCILSAGTKEEALEELCGVLSEAPEVRDGAKLLDAIVEREKVMSTGIGLGIAIPHAKIREVSDFVVALGKSQSGLEFHSLDARPVHFVVMIAGPEDQQERYLQLLARITLKLKDAAVRRRLAEAEDVDGMLQALK